MQGGTPHQHTAKWLDPTTRLARFLEFVQTASRQTGVSQGDRLPGKININTMNSMAVFQALCDAQTSNRYNATQVQAVYNSLIAYRGATPGMNPPDPQLSGTPERPFWSLAVGSSPGNDQWTGGSRGLENTILAPATLGGGPTSARLLDPWAGATVDPTTNTPIHPYQNMELLNKIYNNVTTRSNVFAVWVTVGYFEVTNENSRPVQLGAEIGRSEGRHIRHRFFALVDRTKMELARFQGIITPAVNQAPSTLSYALFPAPVPTGTNAAGKQWQFQLGNLITFNPDSDFAETTSLINDGAGGFKGLVRLNYATNPAQQTVVQRGNPGPWARYDPKLDPCVLYIAPID
jgi:hypothetical protein